MTSDLDIRRIHPMIKIRSYRQNVYDYERIICQSVTKSALINRNICFFHVIAEIYLERDKPCIKLDLNTLCNI